MPNVRVPFDKHVHDLINCGVIKLPLNTILARRFKFPAAISKLSDRAGKKKTCPAILAHLQTNMRRTRFVF